MTPERELLSSDVYCPSCGHNRDKSSVSTIALPGGWKQCQMCGATWSEIDALLAQPATPAQGQMDAFARPANARAVAEKLEEIADALDRTLGDTDITHIEDDEELRERSPVQWACTQINLLLQASTLPEAPQPSQAVLDAYTKCASICDETRVLIEASQPVPAAQETGRQLAAQILAARDALKGKP